MAKIMKRNRDALSVVKFKGRAYFCGCFRGGNHVILSPYSDRAKQHPEQLRLEYEIFWALMDSNDIVPLSNCTIKK